jgi:hypothetical protein
MIGNLLKSCFFGPLPFKIFSIILFLLIIVWIWWGVNIERKDKSLSGKFSSKTTNTLSESLSLMIGNSKLTITTSDYVKGYAVKPFKSLCGSDYEITFRKGEKRVLISAQITSIDGKIVAEFVNNEWTINTNNYFKRTYTDHGLKIVDNYNLPILQLDFDGNIISVQGVFITNKNTIVATQRGGTKIMGGTVSLEQIRNALKDMSQDIN